jgi:hypothetical protein
MNKQTVNNFIKGLNKDIDKSIVSKDSYLDARNVRIVTQEGQSSGALENIKGNKLVSGANLTSADTIIEDHVYLVVVTDVTYNDTEYNLNESLLV